MHNHPDIIASRQDLRHQVLGRRDRLSARERHLKSGALAARLMGLEPYARARSILFFASFRSEVDTFLLMEEVLAGGRQLALPLTVTREKQLRIYEVRDLEEDLVRGYQGILEPDPTRCAELGPAELDLVIVPGSVFDRQGGRMCYGGGYCDRFLANRAPQATRVGICFDLQLVTEVPMAPHDQYVDYVVTESRIAERPASR